jgi:hypothetical protein
VIVRLLCPDCQTTDENLEAEVNAATIDYYTDGSGLLNGVPKGMR